MSQLQNFEGLDNPLVGDIETITGNSGGAAGADGSGNFDLTGDNPTGLNVVTSPGTFSAKIFGLASSTTQIGTVALADGTETTTGTNATKAVTPLGLASKLGSQTSHGLPYGNATTGAIQWLAEATNGKIPIGSTGNPPVLANITSLDGTITVINGAGTIDLSATSSSNTTSTMGAVTSDLFTIPLGGIAGTFHFEARVKAFEATTPAGAGYNVFGTYTTDGLVATLVGDQPLFNENVALAAADAYFTTDGSNNAILQVLGVALLTINWSGQIIKI